MSDVMTCWQYMAAVLVKLQLICLLIWYHSIRYAPWPLENQREKLLRCTYQLTLWNPIRHFCCYVANVTYMLAGPVPFRVESCLICRCSCNKYTCWPNATATITAAVQTCLLVECCSKMDACWNVDTQWSCLPIFCHSILHAHWWGGSISALPASVVSNYQSCLLMWCLTIAMPSSVVHHYQPCLLVWCLTIGHAVGAVPHYRPQPLVWCLI